MLNSPGSAIYVEKVCLFLLFSGSMTRLESPSIENQASIDPGPLSPGLFFISPHLPCGHSQFHSARRLCVRAPREQSALSHNCYFFILRLGWFFVVVIFASSLHLFVSKEWFNRPWVARWIFSCVHSEQYFSFFVFFFFVFFLCHSQYVANYTFSAERMNSGHSFFCVKTFNIRLWLM